MESFDFKKYNESFSKKEYVIGKKTKYYILTVKLARNYYKLLLLKSDMVLDESHQKGLTNAKYVALDKLYKHNPNALDTNKVCMVHYKEDRPSGKAWYKDSSIELKGHINTYFKDNDFSFPALNPNSRNREYENYDINVHSKVIFEYLFNERSHRWIDENVIKIDPNYSRGYQAMGILHYIGLQDIHKGIFNGLSVEEAVQLLSKESQNHLNIIINALKHVKDLAYIRDNSDYDTESKEYPEGKEAYKIHRFRERNSKVVKEAKKAFKEKHGELFCQICGINFEKIYGVRGKDFIEAHHTKPLSKMKDGEKTKLEDIAMLCSNCHRMIHRSPMISIEKLREISQNLK